MVLQLKLYNIYSWIVFIAVRCKDIRYQFWSNFNLFQMLSRGLKTCKVWIFALNDLPSTL